MWFGTNCQCMRATFCVFVCDDRHLGIVACMRVRGTRESASHKRPTKRNANTTYTHAHTHSRARTHNLPIYHAQRAPNVWNYSCIPHMKLLMECVVGQDSVLMTCYYSNFSNKFQCKQ